MYYNIQTWSISVISIKPNTKITLTKSTKTTQFGAKITSEDVFNLGWNGIVSTKNILAHLICDPLILTVPYLRSKVTDCNEWDAVRKFNMWAFRWYHILFTEFTTFSRNTKINKVSKLFVKSLYLHTFIFTPNKFIMKSVKMNFCILPAGPFTTALLSVVNCRIVSMIGGALAGSGLVLATLASNTRHLTFCMCLLGRWQARKSIKAKSGAKYRVYSILCLNAWMTVMSAA